jgi:hypothetical protein
MNTPKKIAEASGEGIERKWQINKDKRGGKFGRFPRRDDAKKLGPTAFAKPYLAEN